VRALRVQLDNDGTYAGLGSSSRQQLKTLHRLHPVVYLIFNNYIMAINTTSNIGISSMRTIYLTYLI
jgi:hypothetical protein